MTKHQVNERRMLRGVALLVGGLVLASCAEPARVVLYEERNKTNSPVVAPKAVRNAPTTVRKAPKRVRKPSPAVVASKPATEHQVRSGDTVYTIALRYQVPIRGLIALNGLQAPYILRSGQRLRLPKPRRHVVQPGDTIYRISRTYDVALSRLVQLNRIEPPYKIIVGRVLRLPDSVEPVKPVVAAKPVVKRPVTASKNPPATVDDRGKPRPKSKPLAKTVKQPAQSKRPVAAVPKPPPLSKRKFLLPVRGRLLSKFGPKGRGLRNDGVNIAAPRGTPVRAAENGIVVYSGNALLGFGNMILVRHANGYMTAYAHNDTISVGRGDTVRRGQVIATVGSTGNVSSPQLHFEIRKGKRAINPAKLLPNLTSARRG